MSDPRSSLRSLALALALLVGFLSTNADATIARRATGTASGAIAAATTASVSLGAGVANGDLVILNIVTNGASAVTPPSGWTFIGANSYFGSSGDTSIWYHLWHTGDATSGLSFSLGGTFSGSWQTAAYSGALTAPTFVFLGQSNGSSTTATSPSINPFAAGDMLLMIYGPVATGITWSAPSEGTINIQGPNTSLAGCIADFSLVVGTATGAQTATMSSATFSGGVQISIHPANAASNTGFIFH